MKIDYATINSQALKLLLSTKTHMSSISLELKALLELRVSQINGCAYCLDLHSQQARKAGVEQQRLDCLPAASESGLFSEKEVSALKWADKLTNIQNVSNHDLDAAELLAHFNEKEIVDITMIVSLMNCMNRIAISMGDRPEVAIKK